MGRGHRPANHPAAPARDTIYSAAFSPDGRQVVTASGDNSKNTGEARVWDAATGQPLTPLFRHDSEVRFAAFSPDGRRDVTSSDDGKARVWAIAPDNRPAGDLKVRAEPLAGERVDATDGLVTLTEAECKPRWDELPSRTRPTFADPGLGV